MKKLILRKPKWMRDDQAMQNCMDVADSIACYVADAEIDQYERMEKMVKIGRCIKRAAKFGGFFSVRGFLNWLEVNRE